MKSRRILAAVLAPVCALSATAVAASAEATTTLLVEGEFVLGNWACNDIQVTKDKVGTLKAGDKIVVSVKDVEEGAQVAFQAGDWHTVGGDGSDFEALPEVGATSVEFVLTDDAIAALDEKNGDLYFIIKGKNATVTKVELVSAEEETPADSEPTSDTTSDTPATSETTSDTTSDTSAETETPGTTDPGATDESTDTLTVEIKVPGKLEGDELNKAIFGDTGYTWADVENAKFTANASTDVFSVQFSTFDGGWYTKGIDTLPTRADEDKWNTEWELTAEDIAAFDTTKNGGGYVKLVNQDEETEFTVTAEITIKKKAAEEDPNNPSTGIALAIAPVVLAGAAAVVVAVNKKRK